MVNKIVQLEDKEGNNVFPVAGSMASDSITTAMLQDGAVTSDKIDFATLDKVDIITGGITLSSTSEVTLPLLTMTIDSNNRPVAGNRQVFDVSLADNTVTLEKDAVFKVYGGIVPAQHTSSFVKIEVKVNGRSVLYARDSLISYQTLSFCTPLIAGKSGDVITLTVQDQGGNADLTNNTYGLNWVTFEQIG